MTEPTAVLPAVPAPKPRRTGLIAAGIAVPVVLIAGGAFAYQQLNGGGPQPDEVLPSTVVAYARLDANPSASQKIKLFKLIRKSPDLAKQFGVKTDTQDLRKDIVTSLLSGCDNIDYAKDIKPWIGDRIGVGVTDPAGTSALIALQVTDEKAAHKGIELAAGCVGFTDPGVAFSKGYALIGQTQKEVDAAVKAAARKTLSADRDFTEDMQSLGDQGIASVWVKVETIAKQYKDQIGDPTTQKSLENQRSSAVALRAGDSSAELTGISHQNSDIGKIQTVNLGALPQSSVLAASVSGGAKQVDDLWTSVTQGIAQDEVDSTLTAIEGSTGFKLPGDLKKLLGDNITLVVGDKNLSTIDSLEGPGDLTKLDGAIALTSNPTDATEIANKVVKAIADNLGIQLAVVSTPKGAVIATNASFAKTFKSGKNLGDKDSYSSVISDNESAYGGFFFDIATAIDAARGMDMPASDKKDLDQLKDLKAFGFSAKKGGDRGMRGTLKLSFK